jgi:small ligand-binding sensory domain FIST
VKGLTRVGAGLSTNPSAGYAAAEAAEQARSALRGAEVDLAFLFLTPQHLGEAEAAVEALQDALEPRCLLGCTSDGVIGRDEEHESGPAIAVWTASLPEAQLEPFHAVAEPDEREITISGLPELGQPALVVLLADPFTLPVEPLVDYLHGAAGGAPIVGGIATGGGTAGAQALVLDREVLREGAVGLALSGVSVRAVVSQGCAPLGPDAVVTRAERNVVYELAGRPALQRLREIVGELPAEDRAAASRSLLAGIVIDENKPEYGRGDFLIRTILGADEESGAIVLGDVVRVGQTMRLHTRDAASADADLELALQEALGGSGQPAGALLFACNGRGTAMFSEHSHDARAVAGAIGSGSLAGFFCGGEIGPVGGRSFLHGFTATAALFLSGDETSP